MAIYKTITRHLINANEEGSWKKNIELINGTTISPCPNWLRGWSRIPLFK